jgi:hypothetical protein
MATKVPSESTSKPSRTSMIELLKLNANLNKHRKSIKEEPRRLNSNSSLKKNLCKSSFENKCKE